MYLIGSQRLRWPLLLNKGHSILFYLSLEVGRVRNGAVFPFESSPSRRRVGGADQGK